MDVVEQSVLNSFYTLGARFTLNDVPCFDQQQKWRLGLRDSILYVNGHPRRCVPCLLVEGVKGTLVRLGMGILAFLTSSLTAAPVFHILFSQPSLLSKNNFQHLKQKSENTGNTQQAMQQVWRENQP